MVRSKITIDFIVESDKLGEDILDEIYAMLDKKERDLEVKLYEVEYSVEEEW
ncbi:MAG: hypothetical protein ACRDD7_06345 [Peptostreptococcaceae bacterium]